MKDSVKRVAARADLDDKDRRLELNRAAAMRSRLKKKMELERLQEEADDLTQARNAVAKRVAQFEILLQESYSENTLLQAQLVQVLNETAILQLRLKTDEVNLRRDD